MFKGTSNTVTEFPVIPDMNKPKRLQPERIYTAPPQSGGFFTFNAALSLLLLQEEPVWSDPRPRPGGTSRKGDRVHKEKHFQALRK